LNIVGAIRLDHLSDAITEQYKTVNGDSIIDFLEKIKRTYASNKTIQLVLDDTAFPTGNR